MNRLPCDPAELARTLFEGAPDALFLFDLGNEQILDLNPAAEKLVGVTRANLIGKSIRILFRAEVPEDELHLQYACRSREGFFLRRPSASEEAPVALTITFLGGVSKSVGLLHARDLRERREARQRLRRGDAERKATEARYRDLWQRNLAAIIRVTAAGQILDCNDAFVRTFGYASSQDVTARSTKDLYLDPKHRSDLLARLSDDGSVANYELQLRRADGSPIWVLAHVNILHEDGQEIHEATLVDISDRKHAEDALRQSETRYRELWQRNLAGIVRASLDGRILDCNESFARLFGFASRQDMFTRSTRDLYFDLGVRTEFVSHLRRHHHLTNYELQMRRADGSPIWVLETVSLLVEDGEEILEGILIDISDRKRAEEALRASETNYRTLISHLDQGIFLKDRELRYVTVNPVFCNVVGLSEEELRGKTIAELFDRNALTEKSQAIERRVLDECRAIETSDVVKIDGKPRSVRISRTPVKGPDGSVVGVLGICWDVTDQLALEAQLRHVQKMDAIGQLAGGIAHDFNNLLTIMLGNLSYVITQRQDWQASIELLKNAEKAGLRAAELTQTLLGFSRRATLTTVPYNLNRAIDEVVRLTRSTLPANIELVVRALPDLWLVQADPGQISQVLTNLTLNARDALPGGGRIIYETSHFVPDAVYLARHLEASEGEFVRLRVRDTGLGIPADLRQRIFEPFFTTK